MKYWLIFGSILAIDQITKAIFAQRDFLVKNYGLPFNIDFGSSANLVLILTALGLFIYYFVAKHKSRNYFAISLILSGAVSNLADRIILGFVRDFADLGLNFTFNLADVFIAAGIVVLFFEKKSYN